MGGGVRMHGGWCVVATYGGGEAVVWKGALSKLGIFISRITKYNPKLALKGIL
jgi:hypothetical protein